MADQPKQPAERPIFTGLVDKFVEFDDVVESELSTWKPVAASAGPPNQILTVQVDNSSSSTIRRFPRSR